MTILTRLEQWKNDGTISTEQYVHLSALSRGEPFSLFVELNLLLYGGVLAFVGGLGWTVSKWSQQLGNVLVLAVLSAIFTGCIWYCYRRAPAWSHEKTASPSLILDYVLYLGALTWSLDLAHLEKQFRVLSGEWDLYLLLTAGLYFLLAYRFDNRFVLSLALSSLAGWFGITVSGWSSHRVPPQQDETYRMYAIAYGLVVGIFGAVLSNRPKANRDGFFAVGFGLKPHFLNTYLNIAANVLFWAVLSGVFHRQDYAVWCLLLVVACGVSLAWGLRERQFAFVAYAAVYGYVGVSSLLLRHATNATVVLAYFVITGVAMVAALVAIARHFGREA